LKASDGIEEMISHDGCQEQEVSYSVKPCRAKQLLRVENVFIVLRDPLGERGLV